MNKNLRLGLRDTEALPDREARASSRYSEFLIATQERFEHICAASQKGDRIFIGRRPPRAASHEQESEDRSVTRVEPSLPRKNATRQSSRPHARTKSKVLQTKAIDSRSPATVLIVEDDPSVLRALNRLVSASGFDVKTFVTPSELLASEIPKGNACMVVDIGLPEMTGIEMCDVLKASGRCLPTILITGRTDVSIRSLATRSNAVAVLFKPFDEQPLLDAIGRAVALSTRDSPKI